VNPCRACERRNIRLALITPLTAPLPLTRFSARLAPIFFAALARFGVNSRTGMHAADLTDWDSFAAAGQVVTLTRVSSEVWFLGLGG